MLTEEAHHMFVGDTGIGRIVQRSADVMAEHKLDDPDHVRALGVIDLPTIQRYLNFHYSVTLDLFGSDVSSNAAQYYTSGLKGRFEETRIEDDHVLADSTYDVLEVAGDRIMATPVPALTALNARLRDDYIREVQLGLDRWNRTISRAGLAFRLVLPHQGFHRVIGNFAGRHISPDGRVLSEEQWKESAHEWLPTASDYAFVQSLMAGRVIEPGRFANWIAPPRTGINRQPVNFEYVRFD
jgi:benzoyl-CoA 2,3-dioxygenase component B